MTQLIVTGDDFGASHEVNEAVEAQYQAGRLTQASLMIHGRHVEEAQRIARRNSGLCVGLHLTLCAAARAGRTDLTDAQGDFEASPAAAGWRYQWNSHLLPGIRTEIEEQFGRFQEAGFAPIYWDGHTHLHLHPVILRETLPVARRYGFRAVRLVQTEKSGGPGWIFNRLSASARGKLNGICFADRVFGLRETGRMDDSALTRMEAEATRFAVAEIYYHPGVDGPGSWRPRTALTHWKDVLDGISHFG